jgi:indolepyruvate ferredoxin oxidoreductase
VAQNARAFALGRWAALHPDQAAALLKPATPATVDPVAFRADHLRSYQNDALARRFLNLVDSAPDPLREAVAKGYHKVLAYKDEYEVARLHLSTLDKARAAFDGHMRPRFWLAPPLLLGKDTAGRPRKRAFGPWMIPVFRLLASLKALRGTAFDVFGRTAERRMERALIAEYEADMAAWLPRATPSNMARLRDLAELPLTIRGFGPVKAANAEKAAARRREILHDLAATTVHQAIAAS